MIIRYQIDTRGTVLTLSYAIVYVMFAIFTRPSFLTLALVITDKILTRYGIRAWIVFTFVDILKTIKKFLKDRYGQTNIFLYLLT